MRRVAALLVALAPLPALAWDTTVLEEPLAHAWRSAHLGSFVANLLPAPGGFTGTSIPSWPTWRSAGSGSPGASASCRRPRGSAR